MPGIIFVTGAAGFVGFHLTQALLRRGETVIGFDNLNDYYDPELKRGRLAELAAMPQAAQFTFIQGDLADRDTVRALIRQTTVDRVIHLGAQAGVRYSIENPFAYLDSNLSGHLAVLEGVRAAEGRIKHLVYASSSSVYGNRAEGAFSEDDTVDSPVSLYAATKRCDELMSQTYSHLYGVKQSGLRFFTVYGPWGRPDMAYWMFTKAIFAGEPIKVFNQGNMRRDFTYIDDIVAGIIATLDNPPAQAANRIYNIGNHNPEQLGDMIAILEREIGIEAKKEMLPMQAGDVVSTYANIGKMQNDFGWRPTTSLSDGLSRFVAWYRERYISA